MSEGFAITLETAVGVCQTVENAMEPIGMHCALTGGCLYRGGSNKDIDIILYPHDPKNQPDQETIAQRLLDAGFADRFVTDENYVNRVVWICGYQGMRIDFFLS